MVNVRKNLAGQTIGNFLVLNQAEDYISPSGTKRAQWNCKCLLCGNDPVIVIDTVLRKKSKKSCGCLEDLTGQRFGRLTVIYREDRDKYGNTIWKCKCDCGNDISVAHNRLTKKNIQSCGCLRKELASKRFSKENRYDLSGEYGIGYCSNTGAEFYFDLEDYDKIKNYCWYEDVSKNGYHSLRAKDKTTNKCIKMHYLLGVKHGDHKNRNPLDNRKSNIRVATDCQNAQNRSIQSNNTSGITGVCWDDDELKWVAYIGVNNKKKKLGRFLNKDDAIRARLEAAEQYFGEFSAQRHMFKEYGIEDDFLESDMN